VRNYRKRKKKRKKGINRKLLATTMKLFLFVFSKKFNHEILKLAL
jgi:hypothetical protein